MAKFFVILKKKLMHFHKSVNFSKPKRTSELGQGTAWWKLESGGLTQLIQRDETDEMRNLNNYGIVCIRVFANEFISHLGSVYGEDSLPHLGAVVTQTIISYLTSRARSLPYPDLYNLFIEQSQTPHQLRSFRADRSISWPFPHQSALNPTATSCLVAPRRPAA